MKENSCIYLKSLAVLLITS
jgi:hypothetical protein